MKLFGILIFVFSLTQCASNKLDVSPSFSIKKASYSHIIGGLPGNGTLNLMIEFTSDKTIYFEKVYFQNRVVNAVIEHKQNKKYIAARYRIATNQDSNDLILSANSEEEYGNTTNHQDKFPYKLKENEAIITYKIRNKIHIYKVENIIKEKRIFMQ